MKKGIKITVYTILVLIVLLSIGIPSYIYYWRTSNTLSTFASFEEPETIDFVDILWVNDTIGGALVEKTAFYVPVKIKGIKEQLYMQFDTGNPATELYDKPLENLLQKYPTLKTTFSKD